MFQSDKTTAHLCGLPAPVVVLVPPEVPEVSDGLSLQPPPAQVSAVGAPEQLVEGVEVVLSGLLPHHAALLQQVVVDVPAHGVALEVEVDVHVLAEAARVVVAVGARVAERLQDVVGLQKDVLGALDLSLAGHVRHRSDVPKVAVVVVVVVYVVQYS